MQSKELEKQCRSLRPGDVVTIDFEFHNEPAFTVEIVKVDRRDFDYTYNGGDRYYEQLPLIHWKSEPNESYLYDQKSKTRFCSAGHVSEIVSRASYSTKNSVGIRNNLYRNYLRWREREAKNGIKPIFYSREQYSGPLYILSSVTEAAVDLLSVYPDLDMPFGISPARMIDEWAKAGYPGLKGYYNYGKKTVLHGQPPIQYGDIHYSQINNHVVNLPVFRKWLLRNYYRIKRTKREFIEHSKEMARDIHRSMTDAIEYDLDRMMEKN